KPRGPNAPAHSFRFSFRAPRVVAKQGPAGEYTNPHRSPEKYLRWGENHPKLIRILIGNVTPRQGIPRLFLPGTRLVWATQEGCAAFTHSGFARRPTFRTINWLFTTKPPRPYE